MLQLLLDILLLHELLSFESSDLDHGVSEVDHLHNLHLLFAERGHRMALLFFFDSAFSFINCRFLYICESPTINDRVTLRS